MIDCQVKRFFLILYFSAAYAPILKTRSFPTNGSSKLDKNTLVDLTSKVTAVKQMYIKYDILTVNHPLSLTQIEATIDTLSAKLASLRYATTLENLQPINIITNENVITLFQTILPLTSSYQACKLLGLEPLALSNLPKGIRTPVPILLQYEISVGTNTVICISQTHTTKEDNCLKDILLFLKKLLSFNSTTELHTYLIDNFVGTVVYILISENKASFTTSPYGYSACLGAYIPERLSNGPYLDVQSLHQHFYEKLNSAYTDIYD